jgi:hypothetical protein
MLQNQPFIKHLAPSFPTHQAAHPLPGSDWQVDFTNMILVKCIRYFLVFIDTLTGWIEAFPTTNKKTSTVAAQRDHSLFWSSHIVTIR